MMHAHLDVGFRSCCNKVLRSTRSSPPPAAYRINPWLSTTTYSGTDSRTSCMLPNIFHKGVSFALCAEHLWEGQGLLRD